MPPRRKTYDTMTEAVREAIAESELSFKALERETGVLRQSLMKFAAGEQTLRLDAADKLAGYFEIKVTRNRDWRKTMYTVQWKFAEREPGGSLDVPRIREARALASYLSRQGYYRVWVTNSEGRIVHGPVAGPGL